MKMNSLTAAAMIGAALLCPSLRAQTASESQPLTPNSVIYLPQVPTVSELSRAAAAKNQSIASIQLMNGVETVAYHLPNNQISIVEYRALPASGSAAAAADPVSTAPYSLTQTAPQPGTVYSSPAPAVVYADAPPPAYYYADGGPYYYPWGWYPAGYLGFGFGGRVGFGGGFRGGYGGHFGGFRR